MTLAAAVIRTAWKDHLHPATREYEPFVINRGTGQLPSRTRKRLFPLLFDIPRASGKLVGGSGDLDSEQERLVVAAIAEHATTLDRTPAIHAALVRLYVARRRTTGKRPKGEDSESQLLAIAFTYAASHAEPDDDELRALLEGDPDDSIRNTDLETAIRAHRAPLEARLAAGWTEPVALNDSAEPSGAVHSLLARLAATFDLDDEDDPVVSDPDLAETLWAESAASDELARHAAPLTLGLTVEDHVRRPGLDGRGGDAPVDQTILRRITRTLQGGDDARVTVPPLTALERAVDASPHPYGLEAPGSHATLLLAIACAGRMLVGNDPAFQRLWTDSFLVQYVQDRPGQSFWRAQDVISSPERELVRRLWNRLLRRELNGSPVSTAADAWREIKGAIVSMRSNLVSSLGGFDPGPARGPEGDGTQVMQNLILRTVEAGFGADSADGMAFIGRLGRRYVTGEGDVDDADTTDADRAARRNDDESEWNRCRAAAIEARMFTEPPPSFSQLLMYLTRVLGGMRDW